MGPTSKDQAPHTASVYKKSMSAPASEHLEENVRAAELRLSDEGLVLLATGNEN